MVVEKQDMRIFDCTKNCENTIMMAEKHGHKEIEKYLRRKCPSAWRLCAKVLITLLIAVPAAVSGYAYLKCKSSIIFWLFVLIYWFLRSDTFYFWTHSKNWVCIFIFKKDID